MNCFIKPILATLLTTMATIAVAAPATTNDTTVTPAERAKIEGVVHQYLVTKPEVIIEAMQVLQNRQMEQAKQSVQKTQKDAPRYAQPLFHQANDPVAGNPNGKVTVVEFFDYQCTHCIDMAPILDSVMKANPNTRVVFKEWPIRGPLSELASRAALAANKQGKYFEYHRALFTNTQPITKEVLMDIGKKLGLDVNKLQKDMNDPSIDTQLKNNMKLAQDLKLFGTPAFFIGLTDNKTGQITYIPGVMDQTQLQSVIDQASK